jgi:hypothetical protein
VAEAAGCEHSHSHSDVATCNATADNAAEGQSREPATPVTCEHSVCVYVPSESLLTTWQDQTAAAATWFDDASATVWESLTVATLAAEHGRDCDGIEVVSARLRAQLQVWLV